MTLSEKIKELRKATGLTQQEFAEKVGVARNNLAGYETGRREPSAAVMELIVTKLNVSEAWLRTGEGDPFNPTPETVIDELVKEYHLDNVDREIIKQFIDLKPEERKIIKDYIQRVAQHIEATDKTLEQEADEFAAKAREQFISEKKRESQALSAKESDVG